MPEQIGMQAVWDNSNYNQGLQEYTKGLAQANDTTQKASGNITGLGTAASGAAAAGLGPLGIAAAMLGVQLLTGVVSTAQDAIAWLWELGRQAMDTAGRFQELTIAAIAIGVNMGATQGEIEAQIASVKQMGIRTDVAAQAVAQFSRYQLDLAKSTQLARVAQDAAVLTGQDSSDTLERLIYAVTTLNPRVARTAGIMVNFGNEFQRVADATGRATDEFTEAERAAIALDAILRQGALIDGTYEAAMGTASKQMRSLTGRIIPELLGALGAPFQEAWYTVVKAVSDLVYALTEAVSEGGALYPTLVNLGAIASLVADSFRALVDVAIGFVRDFRLEFNAGMEGTVEDALSWGIEIAVALADGLVKGISGALSAAMNVIGNLLSAWLAPGSPPKVAPGLVEWAKAAGTMYLRGFTLADFSVLEDLQRVLKQALTGPDFVALSQQLIAGLSGGGELGGAFFSELAAKVGEFGGEISRLAKSYLALAQGTRRAAQAQEELEAAQRRATAAQGQIDRLIREYNQALQEGAAPEVLRSKLAQIQAAEAERDAAAENVKAARDAAEAAKDQVKPLAEQAQLQELLVKQLLELAKVEQKRGRGRGRVGRRAAAVKGKAEVALPEDFLPTGGITGRIVDAVSRAVQEAKAQLLERLGTLFQPLSDKWANEWGPILQNLLWDWNSLCAKIAAVWREVAEPALAQAGEFLQMVFGAAFGVLTSQTVPMVQQAITDLIAILESLNINWDLIAKAIEATFMVFATVAGGAIAVVIGATVGLINGVSAAAANIIGAIGDILRGFQTISEGIQMILSGDLVPGITAIVQGLVDVVIGQFRLVFGTVLELLGGFVQGFVEFIVKLVDELVGQSLIPDLVNDIISAFLGLKDRLITIGKEMVEGLQKSFMEKFNLFKDKVGERIQEFIDWIKHLLGIASKSKVMGAIARDAALGFLDEWEKMMSTGLMMPQMQPAMSSPASTARVPVGSAATGGSRTITIRVGPNTINNGWDAATLGAYVRQNVRDALAPYGS